MKGYFQSTRTATYGFLTAVPLLLAYEFLIILVNPRHGAEVRVGADVWIKQILAAIGASGQHTLVAMTFALGLIIFYRERKKEIAIKTSYFILLLVESLFYSIILASIISNTVGYLFRNLYVDLLPLQANPFASGANFWLQIALSIGAGIYEELFFRVLMINVLYFVLRRLAFKGRIPAYSSSALVAALLFSAVHYIGPFGDAFNIPSFTFRFLFGLAFNVLYVLRGFGVVAWSHTLYDVLLTIRLSS